MDALTASDDATDAIAHIEMHRQQSAHEAGLAPACSEALRKLHELLTHEQEALQRHGAGTRHPANIEAIEIEIGRVKKLMPTTSQTPLTRAPQYGKKAMPAGNAIRTPARSKARRTMGRRGDT